MKLTLKGIYLVFKKVFNKPSAGSIGAHSDRQHVMDAKFTPPHALHLEGCELKTAFNGEKIAKAKWI